MRVPLLDVIAQNLPLEKELTEAFSRVLSSGQFIMGPDVAAFEEEAGARLGVKHAISVSSGTDALLLALMALEIKAGDEVLCPSFTFFATAGCVARVGAVPVFVDSDPATFNIDMNDAARKVTARTKAIIPVHLFGQCAEMEAVNALAAESRLHVIEDAAQAFGARYDGKPSGTMSDFGAYSFFPSKNLGGLGDGGMLVTGSDELAERARVLRNHGAKPRYYHRQVGGNFRLDTLQAAFLRTKLRYLDSYNERRKANAAFYQRELAKVPGLVLPEARPGREHIWNQFTLRVTGPGRRDALKQRLLANGIGCEIYYPVPLHRQECFRGLAAASCNQADQLAAEVLSIPVYPELREEDLAKVVETILKEVQR